ncbi:Kelch domain-containing protein 4 [Chlorella vulgaris]
MGSGRDKRKKVTGKKPGAGAGKTERKTELNESKKGRRQERAAQGGEDDIDALLARFRLQDEKHTSVEKDNEVLLYGGEWYDGERDKMYVYGDVYVLNVDKQTWKRVISPNGPLPRTSHQAVCTRTALWVWGGEFTSLNQEKFRHYSDLWRLNLADWTWEQIPSKGGPSPRSGHRMVLHGKQLLLFGGFFDNGKETRYFNDVWSYDTEELRWMLLGPKAGHTAPSPRGGCQLALTGDQLYIFGGYSVKKAEPDSGGCSGSLAGYSFLPNKKKGGKGEEDEGKGVVHDDVWCLDLKSLEFERIKRQGMAPNQRTAFGLVTHRKRAVLFGGIMDQEGKASKLEGWHTSGDRVYSELFNELYQFNLDSRRWFPLGLRIPKKAVKTEAAAGAAPAELVEEQQQQQQPAQQQDASSRHSSSSLPPGVSPEMHAVLQRMLADKSGLVHTAAATIQANFRGYRAYKTYRLGGEISELLYSPATYGLDLSSKDLIKPRARAAPMLCVLRNTMWMLGGQVEIGHTDIVLDDLWSLDLSKLDGWKCLKANTATDDAFRELSDGEWESGTDSDA